MLQRLSKLTYQERIDALRNAIRRKCRHGISLQQLDLILNGINLNRTYFIKATPDCKKFMNIITEEFVATPERMTISYITPLYGQFRRGRFSKDVHTVISEPAHMSCSSAAAAIKRTVLYEKSGSVSVTHTIVIYEKIERSA